jgi:photosystem II stability/assembly factor-like uncharacterized protein
MNRRAIVSTALLLLAPLARPARAGVDPWTRVGPDSGVVQTFAAAPSRPTTVYAGLSLGGIFRSLDGGATWSFAGAGLKLHDAVRSIVVDVRQPEKVWTATSQGIYRSTNGGKSWARVLTSGGTSLVQDPSSRTLYAGSDSGPMLRGTDDGTSWHTLSGSPQAVFNLAIDPFHPQTLYADNFGELFKSTNGGARWFRLTQGLPADSIDALTIDPRSGTLYVATTSEIPGKVVFRSDDGGAKWTSVDGGMLTGFTTFLAVDLKAKGAVWALSGERAYRSADRGRTWSLADRGLPAGDGAILTLFPGASTLLAGTQEGAFWSADQGASWNRSNQGLRAASITGLALDPLRPARLWASLASREVFRTVTGGGPWGLLTGVPYPVFVTGPLAADPYHPGTVYLGLFGGVARSLDAGNHWSSVTGLSCIQPESLFVDPLDSSVIYVGGNFSNSECGAQPGACPSYRSDDAGQHWNCIQIGPIVVPDPFQSFRVYGLTRTDVEVSADGGDSWSLLAPGTHLSVLVPDPQRPGTLWGGRYGVFHSDDGGRTWTLAGAGVPTSARVVAVVLDPVDPDVLYTATLQNGVFKSTDAGFTWEPLGTGLEGLVVRYLVLDPRDRTILYAGTDEAGVMKILQSGE